MTFALRNVVLATLACCCASCQGPPPKKLPYDDLQLGISLDEAMKLVGREGQKYDHDKLPVIPKPRAGFKDIPESTTWLVWWDDKSGIAVLTLGILDGRVIYKEVLWNESGQIKGERWTLPEYQK